MVFPGGEGSALGIIADFLFRASATLALSLAFRFLSISSGSRLLAKRVASKVADSTRPATGTGRRARVLRALG